MKTSLAKLPKLLGRVLNAGLVPMITSDPGIGKSDVVKQLAKLANLFLIDIRLSQMSPNSLLGFGRINDVTDRSEFKPFNVFPLKGDPVPNGYDGFLIFFDEFNSASLATQAACYKIVLDREIGQYNLHESCFMVCAGNKATSGAIVNRTSTAIQSRVIHFEVEAEKDSWSDWAAKNNIDYRIQAYINFKPAVLNSFSPDHKDNTFTCGRTLEFASKLIKDVPELTIDDLIILAGTLGEGNAREFYAFTSICKELPTMEQIIKDPEGCSISKEPSFMFGVSSFVAEYATKDDMKAICTYIKRFSPDFQVIAIRQIAKRDPSLCSSKHLTEISNNIYKLME